MKTSERTINVLYMIARNAEEDAKSFDGQPFTGKTVGTYLGNHGASIASLAEIMKEIREQLDELQAWRNSVKDQLL